MNTIINAIENAYYYVRENWEAILFASGAVLISGIILGLIMAFFFS